MVLRAFGRPLPAMIRPPTTGLTTATCYDQATFLLVPMLTLGPAPQAQQRPCCSVVSRRVDSRGMRHNSFQLHAGGQHFYLWTRRARTGGARRAVSGRGHFWPLQPHRSPPPPPDAPKPLTAPF